MTSNIKRAFVRDPRLQQAAILAVAFAAGLIMDRAKDPACETGTVTAVQNDSVYVSVGYHRVPNRVIYMDSVADNRKLYEFLRPGDLLKYKNAAHVNILDHTPEIISVNAREYPNFISGGIATRRKQR